MYPRRIKIFFMIHGTAVKWSLCGAIAFVILIGATLYLTRENYEIAADLRFYDGIVDKVRMNILSISDGVVEVYITNYSNTYLFFGHPSISIEYYFLSQWRVLPYRRNTFFILPLYAILPYQSLVNSASFNILDHRPRIGELYRVRFEMNIDTSGERRMSLLLPIHELVAEFIYFPNYP